MKRTYWAPLIAVLLAGLVLVPTTFAQGEPGTSLYATLGPNRFPDQTQAQATLRFNSERNIVLTVNIIGRQNSRWDIRVYSRGTCSFPQRWVINRTPEAGPNGPFLNVQANSGQQTFQVNQLDVDRVRAALNAGRGLALMVAGTHPTTGRSYRTCTAFDQTPDGPITTPTATQTGTQTQTGTNTTRFTTRTVTTVIGTQTTTFTLTEPVTNTTTVGTRTSTGFTTGTSVVTQTSVVGTATTVVVPPRTTTLTSVSTSVGSATTVVVTNTTTSTIAATTTTINPVTSVTTFTTTFTNPVTTVVM